MTAIIGSYPESAPRYPTPWTYSAATGAVEDALGNRLFGVPSIELGHALVGLVNEATGAAEPAPRIRVRIEDAVGAIGEPESDPDGDVEVGAVFDGIAEPGVPVGTVLTDSEGDQVKRLSDGRWSYHRIRGRDVSDPVAWEWHKSNDGPLYGPYTVESLPG